MLRGHLPCAQVLQRVFEEAAQQYSQPEEDLANGAEIACIAGVQIQCCCYARMPSVDVMTV